MVFVDTSALYAVLDRDDSRHREASDTWQHLLRSDTVLLTHNYVLIEIAALAQNRLGLAALRTIQDDMMPVLRVHWIIESWHNMAVQMVLTADRKKLSVVDCTSFLVMRELGIRDAFAFDRHFADQGFRTIPDPAPAAPPRV